MRFVQSLFLKSQHIWLSIMDKITSAKTLVPPGRMTDWPINKNRG